MKYLGLIAAILAFCVTATSCTFSMCHPYKLNGLCEYVGSDGLNKL